MRLARETAALRRQRGTAINLMPKGFHPVHRSRIASSEDLTAFPALPHPRRSEIESGHDSTHQHEGIGIKKDQALILYQSPHM